MPVYVLWIPMLKKASMGVVNGFLLLMTYNLWPRGQNCVFFISALGFLNMGFAWFSSSKPCLEIVLDIFIQIWVQFWGWANFFSHFRDLGDRIYVVLFSENLWMVDSRYFICASLCSLTVFMTIEQLQITFTES